MSKLQQQAACTSIVKLDVGGKIFTTKVETLRRIPNTFFYALCSEMNTQYKPNPETGAYFIDRDPTFFDLVLNHMRGVDIVPVLQQLNAKEKTMFFIESEFYGLGPHQKPLPKPKILFLGLDNAGKTTLLHALQNEKLGSYPPTTHPNMGTFTLEEREFHVYDLGGYKSVRVMWKDFLANNINALVFVIDASDANQFQEAKKELDVLLETVKVPILILGNKTDKKGAMSEAQLVQAFGLAEQLTGKNDTQKEEKRPLQVFMCSTLNQTGYKEAFQWLIKLIKTE